MDAPTQLKLNRTQQYAAEFHGMENNEVNVMTTRHPIAYDDIWQASDDKDDQ